MDVVNCTTYEILAHYELSEELACETAVVICGFLLENNEWTLKNINEPRAETLADLAKYYGIDETHT